MHPSAYQDDDVDLRKLIQTLWAGRRVIVLTTVISAVLSIAYALTATPVYRAEAVVQVREEGKSQGGLAAQLGGLATLAGLPMGGAGGDREFTLATLQSRALLQQFIDEANLLPSLYPDIWDAERKAWVLEKPWFSSREPKPPTAQRAVNRLRNEILRVDDDKMTGLVSIAIEWTNPQEAAAWVTGLIDRTSHRVNDVTIREAEQNLAYLAEQSQQASTVEVQQTIALMTESEMKKLMVARNEDGTAFKMIDPAQVPLVPVRPKAVLIVALAIILGGILGVAWVFLANALRQKPRDSVAA